MIKLVIFDLDGTLIDSAPDVVATTNDLVQAKGLPPLPREMIVAAIGEGLARTIFKLFPEAQNNPLALAKIEKEFLAHYEVNLLRHTTVFPGVKEALARCVSAGRQIAIVTNKHERLTRKTLVGLGLDHLPWMRVFGADSLAQRKPDPLPLLEVMKAAQVSPNETLMVGDGLPDMLAANRAGVRSVAVEFGYGPLEALRAEGASLTLRHYDELDRVIKRAEEPIG
jgi:phosphoglycolate phosphatase